MTAANNACLNDGNVVTDLALSAASSPAEQNECALAALDDGAAVSGQ
jgi:hypothetical protein